VSARKLTELRHSPFMKTIESRSRAAAGLVNMLLADVAGNHQRKEAVAALTALTAVCKPAQK